MYALCVADDANRRYILYVPLALCLAYILWCLFVDEEAIFVIVGGKAWEIPMMYRYLKGDEALMQVSATDSANVIRRCCASQLPRRGRLPGVDWVYISHHKALHERRVSAHVCGVCELTVLSVLRLSCAEALGS